MPKKNITSSLSVERQIFYYSALLTNLSVQYSDEMQRLHRESYAQVASQPITIDGQQINVFAPYRKHYSALRTFTKGQIAFLLLGVLLLSACLYFYSLTTFSIIIIVFTAFYAIDLLFFLYLSVLAVRTSGGIAIDDTIVYALANAPWPTYTVLCPLYHEAAVVPQLINGMLKLDYPTSRLQILLLLQDDDPETLAALKQIQLPPHIQVVILPSGKPQTKPRACNYGLMQATGDFIVIYDAEDIPDPLQLKKTVLVFADGDTSLACVQAKLNVYNGSQNLLTRWFSANFYLWFDTTLPGLIRLGLPIPLGGTSNHFRTPALRLLGGWDAFNVTEDCDLGLRMAHYGLKTVILDSTTYEEANSQVKNWFRQRIRWNKGFMQTYLVNMRRPYRYLHPRLWPQFVSLQLIIGLKTALLLLNPVMWTLLIVYVAARPVVEPLYHQLFPSPVLYIGTGAFIFGNFACLYTTMMSCLQRQQHGFIKWILLMPVYWIMLSLAAYAALFDLLFKPHYWGKTQHGLHLKEQSPALSLRGSKPERRDQDTGQQGTSGDTYREKTTRLSGLEKEVYWRRKGWKRPVSLLPTQPLQVVAGSTLPTKNTGSGKKYRFFVDPWFIALMVIACTASLLAVYYYYTQNLILVYKDSNSHLLIARRLIDSLTPGFAQLGGVWLPLPHLIMQPFVWNDALWYSGLAGSLSSMVCYFIAVVYLFLAARNVTRSSLASFVGTLLFVLNPNILYVQATPLSEPLLIATMLMASYHFLLWVQNDSLTHLALAAGGTFLATLARYDAWFLFVALLAGIIVAGLLKRQSWQMIEGKLIAFSFLGGLGIVLWAIWCWIIFGDPLYFQRGPYSSQADQHFLVIHNVLYTYHDLWQSLSTYTLASMLNIGELTAGLAVAGLLVFLWRYRLSVTTIAVLTLLIPFVFYVVSLYTGQAAVFLAPLTKIYNVRYGVEMVVPAAFFVAVLASLFTTPPAKQVVQTEARPVSKRSVRKPFMLVCSLLLQGLLLAGIIWQAGAITLQGRIISLLDGQYGADCAPHSNIVAYLAEHYNGGKVLEDFYTSRKAGIDFTNIHFSDVVYEGSGPLWTQALRNPASVVDWIVANPRDADDMVIQHLDIANPAFLAQYVALLQEPQGMILFHRKQAGELPSHSLTMNEKNLHAVCSASDPRHIRTLSTSQASRPDFQTGVVNPRQGVVAYGVEDGGWANELQEIQQQTAARWIEMPIYFTQTSTDSTDVTISSASAPLAAFEQGIKTAHSLGYHVFVVPLLYPAQFDLGVDEGQRWSGNIAFTELADEEQWFTSYWQALQPYVLAAEQQKAEQFAIGTELEWLQFNAPDWLWHDLIAEFRGSYSGALTYDMNWSSVKPGQPDWLKESDLQRVGVSAYFPLVDQRVRLNAQQLFDHWRTDVRAKLDNLAQEINKPLVLSEIGYRNSRDNGFNPYEAFLKAPVDPEEQALACDAALNNIYNDKYIVGTFFWGWNNVSAFTLRGQPASVVVHTWYNSLQSE